MVMINNQHINVDSAGYGGAMCQCEKCLDERRPTSGRSGSVAGYNWKVPEPDAPEGDLLVLVRTNKGIDKALVFVDEDGQTLRELDGDVWTAWQWEDVTLYLHLDDILPEL